MMMIMQKTMLVRLLVDFYDNEDEKDDKDSAVETVVKVGQGRSLDLDEADGGQGRCQHHEQGHGRGDGGVLDPQDVSAEQTLQLAVLESVSVE